MTEQEHHVGVKVDDTELLGVTFTTNPPWTAGQTMLFLLCYFVAAIIVCAIVSLIRTWREDPVEFIRKHQEIVRKNGGDIP